MFHIDLQYCVGEKRDYGDVEGTPLAMRLSQESNARHVELLHSSL